MMRTVHLPRLVWALVLAGCTAAPAAPTAVPSPTLAPATPSAAPDFAIEVSPPDQPSANRMAIPGSKYCFLVRVDDPGANPAPVTIQASATGARVVETLPAELVPGRVGEVWIMADPTASETTGTLTITATRGPLTKTVTRSVPVFPMADERAADARPYFQRWVAWLAAAHPELGINASVAWEPIFVSTLLVVSHYSYWSSDWEMTVAWHNMIPPYDWTEVHLRRRGIDLAPSLAFRIDSVSTSSEPHPVEPPSVVVR